MGSRKLCALGFTPIIFVALGCSDSNEIRIDSPHLSYTYVTMGSMEYKKIYYEARKGFPIGEGDILLYENIEDADKVRSEVEEGRTPARRVNIFATNDQLWSGGIVPYVIHSSLDSIGILQAISTIHSVTTNVTLVPRVDQSDYLSFVPVEDKLCASRVGRRGGSQKVLVGEGCDSQEIVHELLHALGFGHEHNCPIRDQFVLIHWENIKKKDQYNFTYSPFDRCAGAYDISSLMHYLPFTFSKNGKPTIVRRGDGSTQGVGGEILSSADISGIETLYPKSPANQNLLGKFSLDGPGSPTFSLTPIVTWLLSEGASDYVLKIDDNADCLSPLFAYTTKANEKQLPALVEGTYFACLLSRDGSGFELKADNSPFQFVVLRPLASRQPDGTLDTSYGINGQVSSFTEGKREIAKASALQADGKLVVGGNRNNEGIALRRYTLNGSLDESFGTGGVVTAFPPCKSGEADLFKILFQPDGKMVVLLKYGTGVALGRFLPSGAVDPTFGTNGTFILFGDKDANPLNFRINGDGSFYVIANSGPLLIAHILANGTINTSFGTVGTVTIPESKINASLLYKRISFIDDHKFLVFFHTCANGCSPKAKNRRDLAVLRFDVNGNLDRGFGDKGKVKIDNGDEDIVGSIGIRSNGNYVVSSGFLDRRDGYSIVQEFFSDGTVNQNFSSRAGSGGWGDSIVFQRDEKTLVFHENAYSSSVHRYSTDGSLDNTFGIGGSIGSDELKYPLTAEDMFQLQSGKCLIAGTLKIPEGGFGIRRYHCEQGG